MSATYKANYYLPFLSLSIEKVKEQIVEEGYTPILIKDKAGAHYEKHSHQEQKLLALLEGSMRVITEGNDLLLKKGDKLVIPGMVEHEAFVGDEGCQFFWSEKLVKGNI